MQASFKILSAIERVSVGETPLMPGNNAPSFACWYSANSWARPGWMSTTRVLSLPLVVDFLKVNVSPLISVVWSAKASDTRQLVNKQMPNGTLSRGVRNPSVNSRLNSSGLRILHVTLDDRAAGKCGMEYHTKEEN